MPATIGHSSAMPIDVDHALPHLVDIPAASGCVSRLGRPSTVITSSLGSNTNKVYSRSASTRMPPATNPLAAIHGVRGPWHWDPQSKSCVYGPPRTTGPQAQGFVLKDLTACRTADKILSTSSTQAAVDAAVPAPAPAPTPAQSAGPGNMQMAVLQKQWETANKQFEVASQMLLKLQRNASARFDSIDKRLGDIERHLGVGSNGSGDGAGDSGSGGKAVCASVQELPDNYDALLDQLLPMVNGWTLAQVETVLLSVASHHRTTVAVVLKGWIAEKGDLTKVIQKLHF